MPRHTNGPTERVAETLWIDGGWMTTRHLIEATGIPRTTLSATIRRMVANGEIEVRKRRHMASLTIHGSEGGHWTPDPGETREVFRSQVLNEYRYAGTTAP